MREPGLRDGGRAAGSWPVTNSAGGNEPSWGHWPQCGSDLPPRNDKDSH